MLTATPEKTASPHPAVIESQPAPSAFEPVSRTPPTTPFPKRMRTIVPTNSPNVALFRFIETEVFAVVSQFANTPMSRCSPRPLADTSAVALVPNEHLFLVLAHAIGLSLVRPPG